MDKFNTNMADGLVKELGSVLGMAESLMNSLPAEAKAQIPLAQADISKMRDAMAKGDSSVINDVVKKYSNISAYTMRKK